MKKVFRRVVMLVFTVSILITSSAHAAETSATTDIDFGTRSAVQQVIDYEEVTMRAPTMFGPWNEVYRDVYYKDLTPPTGYQYVLDSTDTITGNPYYVTITRYPLIIVCERVDIITYNYKLEPLNKFIKKELVGAF